MKKAQIMLTSIYLIAWSVSMSQSSDWKFRKDENGITIHTRSVEGIDLDEFKGVVVLDHPISKLVATMKDVDNYAEWLPDCEKAELLKKEGNIQYQYSVTSAPFPVSDRDAVGQYEYITIANGLEIRMTSSPDYLQKVDGLVRIPYMKGFWRFESLSDSKTKVTYQLVANPGGSIPAWLANSAAVDTPYETLLQLRQYLE